MEVIFNVERPIRREPNVELMYIGCKHCHKRCFDCEAGQEKRMIVWICPKCKCKNVMLC